MAGRRFSAEEEDRRVGVVAKLGDEGGPRDIVNFDRVRVNADKAERAWGKRDDATVIAIAVATGGGSGGGFEGGSGNLGRGVAILGCRQ